MIGTNSENIRFANLELVFESHFKILKLAGLVGLQGLLNLLLQKAEGLANFAEILVSSVNRSTLLSISHLQAWCCPWKLLKIQRDIQQLK